MDVTLEQVRSGLREARYITTPRVETALFLTLTLEKPLLAEGPAGAGKTELGKVLAGMLGAELLRLQCYEGLDEARALFEWNYQKQLLRIQVDRGEGRHWDVVAHDVFSPDFLLRTSMSLLPEADWGAWKKRHKRGAFGARLLSHGAEDEEVDPGGAGPSSSRQTGPGGRK